METKLKVLLVEDSQDDAELILRELRRGNYNPLFKRVDSATALEKILDQEQWDVIISDYAMPGFNGHAALQLVKAKELDIPFIVVSGTIGEEIAVEVMKAGAHDYLMKDNLTRLVPAIERELQEAVVRKEAQEAQNALRESEQRLQLALVGANDGVWDWNIQTDEVFYSPRWAEMLGFTTDEIKPTKSFWDELIHPKDLQEVENALNAHLRELTLNFESEYRIRTKSGEWIWILTRGKVVTRDSDGRPLRAAGTNKDITKRRQLEEQLRQAQKMESIGLLAGGIAHDFNNLLTVILGHVDMELAAAKADAKLSSTQTESLEQIKFAAERAASLTRQLLAFSKKQVTKLEVLEPHRILTDFEHMLKRIIGEDIQLQIVQEPNIGQIRADAGLIEQIIMNLVVNARDAMPEGGTITIRISNATLKHVKETIKSGPQSRPHVLIELQDTGAGMDKETQERIFEPFFTTKPAGKGTGLGLATVYGIVKQFGGDIEVASELGEGTTFKIYLPTVDLPVSVQPKKKKGNAVTGHETILLCEDDVIVRNLIHKILDRAGYKVLAAQNSQQTLQLASKHQSDICLLITDVVMPDIGGYKLAESLMKSHVGLPVLFVSGYSAETFAFDKFEKEVDFLGKPFAPNELLQRVRDLLDQTANNSSGRP